MKIEVSQDDINFGRRRSTGYCPIALAAQRTTGEKWIVGSNMMWKQDSPQDDNLYFAPEVELFIKNFDEGKPVNPFSFEI
jgi:hypothetical protein